MVWLHKVDYVPLIGVLVEQRLHSLNHCVREHCLFVIVPSFKTDVLSAEKRIFEFLFNE